MSRLIIEEEENTIKLLLDIMVYNGYESFIDDIFDVIKQKTYRTIYYPKKWGRNFSNECPGIVWQYLVLKYGESGDSPRFGWILKENQRFLINTFSEYYSEKVVN